MSKKGPFGGVFGSFQDFLYGMSQGPFDHSLHLVVYPQNSKKFDEIAKKKFTSMTIDVKNLCQNGHRIRDLSPKRNVTKKA
jgi:hypothetical protein